MSATVVLLTGAQASGKSTVGRALAALAPRAVFLDGDTFWQAVVAGRADMAEQPTAEALEQLRLRYRALGTAARVYAEAGFVTVLADNVYGDSVQVVRDAVAPLPLVAVALTPPPEVIAARERERGSTAYAAWTDSGRTLLEAARLFDGWVQATPVDRRHDSADETPEQAAEAIHRWLLATG